MRSPSVLPCRSSITRNGTPRSMPESVTGTTLGWASADSAFASSSNRRRHSGMAATSGCSTLIATNRSQLNLPSL